MLSTTRLIYFSYIPSTTENNIEFPENSQHEPEHLTIMKWLTPIEYASQHAEFVNIRQKRIGEWLLNTDKYREWERQNKKVLFYPGIPGADKTIIASLVVDHLSKIFQNDNEVGIAYIYCNHKRQEKQKPVDLLKSLLKQLIQRQPYLPPSVKTLYKQHKGRRSSPSLDEVSEAVHSVIANYSRAFIIIDALDEAQGPDGSRAMFMSEIYKLQVHTKANIFITSRYMHDIKEEIEGYTSLEIRW